MDAEWQDEAGPDHHLADDDGTSRTASSASSASSDLSPSSGDSDSTDANSARPDTEVKDQPNDGAESRGEADRSSDVLERGHQVWRLKSL
jgi:hypothetical protein